MVACESEEMVVHRAYKELVACLNVEMVVELVEHMA